MNRFLTIIFCILFLNNNFIKIEEVKALVPYYYFPSIKDLERESLLIGTKAYQLLYFGEIKKSLNLAKLAVKINKSNDKLWLILAEAQIANKFYEEALISLKKALINVIPVGIEGACETPAIRGFSIVGNSFILKPNFIDLIVI